MQHSDSAADRKLIAERLHGEQWTKARIAAALNVSLRTIRSDLDVDRRCRTCHKKFVPKRSDARHCSAACKQKAYRHSLKRPDTPDVAVVLTGDERREAIETIERCHYTKSVSSGKSIYMRFGEALVVWSLPANKNIARFVLGFDGVVWELSRLWAPDRHEKNLLTRAIAAAVNLLVETENPDAVVSYADPNANHLGGVYRAASWVDHGQREESRAYRGPNGHVLARRAFHSGRTMKSKAEIEAAGFEQLSLPGKHRFVRFLSRRARKVVTLTELRGKASLA